MTFDVQSKNKVLISAYACNPYIGSEAMLGWNWVECLAARNFEVWVITREINKPDIEKYISTSNIHSNIHFIYYDNFILLPILKLLKARFRYFYYYVWQWYAYKIAAKHHKTISFNYVHHITWVQVRMPSFMWRLDIPFIFGPVGGGEKTPWRLWGVLGLRQWSIDLLRELWSLISHMDPFVRLTFRKAKRILVTSKESLELVPKSERIKCRLQLAIAYETETIDNTCNIRKNSDKINIIFVGRFLGWKGMTLGITAFSRLLKLYPNAELTMIGTGPAEKKWKKQTRKLQIESSINWVEWMPHNEVMKMYETNDIMLFPSLHDSGGFVVLEAMSRGLPVVCLDLGGPGIVVNDRCGIKVQAQKTSRRDVENKLFDALKNVASDNDYRCRLSEGAIMRVKDFNWDALIDSCYSEV